MDCYCIVYLFRLRAVRASRNRYLNCATLLLTIFVSKKRWLDEFYIVVFATFVTRSFNGGHRVDVEIWRRPDGLPAYRGYAN